MTMFYCKFHQVAIPIAPTVPDVILSLEPIILVSDTWHTAIDFANPFPPMISYPGLQDYAAIHLAEKAVNFTVGRREICLS